MKKIKGIATNESVSVLFSTHDDPGLVIGDLVIDANGRTWKVDTCERFETLDIDRRNPPAPNVVSWYIHLIMVDDPKLDKIDWIGKIRP